ncbi:ABC transporter permease [Emticicia sp. 21SJ11W-3]|uniref:cell division protein FtsX n=1 Tax=Emticicia sp. 21SJ11W-3 TaxID=2916755 RepID=UPI00209F930D|nr:permease-like cell division protein FtsX [Emticicia sp. 21SJ11W-3]UTA70159.1 permease-like cell division protein FtsX [Emticicia sp. 21SJ11W-3]
MSKRKIGSFPSLLIIISLTTALFLIAFVGWIAITSKQLVGYVRQNVEVQVYLDKSTTPAQQDSIHNLIIKKNYVAYLDNTPQIKFISKESTAQKVLKELKEDYKPVLGENPYRDAFNIKIQEDYQSEANLVTIKKDLEQIAGVFEVNYAKDFIDSVNKNAYNAFLIIASIIVILLIAIILLINNTIRLALYSQRLIIRSMQLVGATNWFIQRPFIGRGLLHGLFSGLIAIGLFMGVQQIAINKIPSLIILQDYLKIGILCGGVIVLGILISVLSTFQSMYRYLRMNLDDLY